MFLRVVCSIFYGMFYDPFSNKLGRLLFIISFVFVGNLWYYLLFAFTYYTQFQSFSFTCPQVMDCIIPGLNLKIVAKALHALAKVGDDLYIEARKEKISLVALNLRKTVCVQFYLLDNFFSSYKINENEFGDGNDAIICKIHMKTLLPLFKGTHLDKKFDYVKMEYENNTDVLVFKMKYRRDDMLMTHNLRLMESETLTIEIKPDMGNSNILTNSSLYNQLLGLFSHNDDEITLEISKQNVIARNYCVGAPVKPKHVRSQVNLNSYEFNIFQVNNETSINFSLKPLRTAIQFAEGFNLNIGLNFEKGGRPLSMVMKNPTFEVNFVVATLNPYTDVHSSMATTSIPAKITQHNVNLTTEDQEALRNENWNDFGIDEIVVNPKRVKKRKSPVIEILEMEKKSNKISKHNTRNNINSSSNSTNKKKIFSIPEESSIEVNTANDFSSQDKRTKLVFGRCFESTFSPENFGDVLAPNSDSE